ncbi:MAG: toll/interleukin-1 receptor domain-containing protein [Bryobacteraceae bacterium]
MLSVFLCYAGNDKSIARELADFLEAGAGIHLFFDDGEIAPGETVISKTDDGLAADVILVLLSPASSPQPWPREEWEPVWRHIGDSGAAVAAVLVEDCPFPALLRRQRFYDLRSGKHTTFRAIRRWVRMLRVPAEQRGAIEAEGEAAAQSPRQAEIGSLCAALADQPGVGVIVGDGSSGETALALDFARACRADFDAVLAVACAHQSLARTAGELAYRAGLNLPGEIESVVRNLREWCAGRRTLVLLDQVRGPEPLGLIAGGRSSTAITTSCNDLAIAGATLRIRLEPGDARSGVIEPSEMAQVEIEFDRSVAACKDDCADARQIARRLLRLGNEHGRLAEAFETLETLHAYAKIRADRPTLEFCSREMARILYSWDRTGEAEHLEREWRFEYQDQMSFKF